MYHTEHDFAQPVAALVRAQGVVYFDEIYRFIERTFDLSEADMETIPSNGRPRYKQILTNLRSNRTLESLSGEAIVPIDRGFATREYAVANNIRIVELGAEPNRRTRRVCARREPKLTPQLALHKAFVNLGKPRFQDQKRVAADVRNALTGKNLSNAELVSLAERLLEQAAA